jgi:hypothetical protein
MADVRRRFDGLFKARRVRRRRRRRRRRRERKGGDGQRHNLRVRVRGFNASCDFYELFPGDVYMECAPPPCSQMPKEMCGFPAAGRIREMYCRCVKFKERLKRRERDKGRERRRGRQGGRDWGGGTRSGTELSLAVGNRWSPCGGPQYGGEAVLRAT